MPTKSASGDAKPEARADKELERLASIELSQVKYNALFGSFPNTNFYRFGLSSRKRMYMKMTWTNLVRDLYQKQRMIPWEVAR